MLFRSVAAAGTTATDPSSGGFGRPSLVIENTAPAGGVAPVVAPFNAMFTFFGQFFDHGLDLVGKSSTSYVAIPIPTGEGDPLVAARGMPMLLNRTVYPATSNVQLTAGTNRTTPWVDQNQTYASAASKQVFLREYTLDGAGRPIASGRLLTSAGGAIADWGTVKAQAAAKLGIRLTDADVTNVPLLLTDEYGRFLRGPRGLPQLVLSTNPVTVVNGVTASFTISPSPSSTSRQTIYDAEGSQGSNSGFGTRNPISQYIWNFGETTDIETTSNRLIGYTYSRAGIYTVTLTVVDTANRRATTTRNITVN